MKKFLAIAGLLALTTLAWADQVLHDDMILKGRLCVGTSCQNGEAFAAGVGTIFKDGEVGIGGSPVLSAGSFGLDIVNASPEIHLHDTDTGTTATDGANFSLDGVDLFINNREAGDINFHVNGSERMSIDSGGLLQLGAANATVTTIYDTDALTEDSATALATQQSIKAYHDADFATGTWTPALTFGDNAVDMTYDVQTGTWTRVKDTFTAAISITLTAKGSSTGAAEISMPTVTGYTITGSKLVAIFGHIVAMANLTSAPGGDTSASQIGLHDYSTSARVNLDEGNFTDTTNIVINVSGILTP